MEVDIFKGWDEVHGWDDTPVQTNLVERLYGSMMNILAKDGHYTINSIYASPKTWRELVSSIDYNPLFYPREQNNELKLWDIPIRYSHYLPDGKWTVMIHDSRSDFLFQKDL